MVVSQGLFLHVLVLVDEAGDVFDVDFVDQQIFDQVRLELAISVEVVLDGMW